MEKKINWKLIGIILLSLQALLQTVATAVVIWLNMLPNDYVVVLILAMVLLLEATLLFALVPVKNMIKLWRRIAASVVSVAIIAGSLVIAKMGLDAYNLLYGVTGEYDNIRNSYVLVLNESPANTLADTKDFRYGVVGNFDVAHTQQLILTIEEQTSTSTKLTYYKQATVMVDALYNKEADAIIMNEASVSLLVEEPGYEDFLNRVRILYTMSFVIEDADKNEGDIVSTPFVMYVSGSDTRNQTLVTYGRSDVNILAVVNPVTKQILLVSTPRDYYVPNPAGNGALDKLTHCGNSGIDVSMKALGDLYGVDVGYYSQINFVGFEKLIDAIGGISVYSDQTFTSISDVHFEKGWNELNGNQAMWYVRERFNVSGGDNTRGKHQMQVIQAVFEKMSSSKTLISNYADILKSIEGMFATSLAAEDISSLVKMQLGDMASWNIRSVSVDGRGDYQETYSVPGQALYVTWPDEDSVNHAKGLCQKVLNGEILTDEDMTPAK